MRLVSYLKHCKDPYVMQIRSFRFIVIPWRRAGRLFYIPRIQGAALE